MKRNIAVLIFLFSSIPLFSVGWVYMGLYPFIYDADSTGWSYSPAPVIWHQDIQSGEWMKIGTPPENYIPEDILGLKLSICVRSSCWEGFYHGYTFLTDEEAEAWNFSRGHMGIEGYSPASEDLVKYRFYPIGLNKVLFVAAKQAEEFEEVLYLEFTGPNEGFAVGGHVGYNDFGKRIWQHGDTTFTLNIDGP